MYLKIKCALLSVCFLISVASAQTKAPDNWFNLDATANNVNGVSTEKTYADLLKGKKSQTVIVAVIDGGVDYNHEDLKSIMWTNTGEIPGNGKDDDGNGYVDDVHGWNFLGGADGKNVNHETIEMTRLYAKIKPKYDNIDSTKVAASDKKEYEQYKKWKKEVEQNVKEAQEELAQLESIKTIVAGGLDAVAEKLGDKPAIKENLEAINAGANPNLNAGKNILLKRLSTEGGTITVKGVKEDLMEQIQEGIDHYETKAKYQYNVDYNPRKDIVKDDQTNDYEHNYGNNDVKGPDAMHGTHVAGIIGAIRNNNIGINGIADNVRIMAVRVVPDGDERDKDVANGIMYAVDNGAQVINMSFGKGYSWDKAVVDKAVKYAAAHDVLIVHAAGNDSKDNDDKANSNFPTAKYEKPGWFHKKKAPNWIEVGALSWKKGEDAVASFSNFGHENVDVFSPGVDIYSTVPDGKYKSLSGTSMASPVTAGVAALIRSYFPTLTAEQVKMCIENSVTKQNYQVKKPGSDATVPFSSLSKTGGIVNVYEAVKLASTVQGKKKIKTTAPRA